MKRTQFSANGGWESNFFCLEDVRGESEGMGDTKVLQIVIPSQSEEEEIPPCPMAPKREVKKRWDVVVKYMKTPLPVTIRPPCFPKP